MFHLQGKKIHTFTFFHLKLVVACRHLFGFVDLHAFNVRKKCTKTSLGNRIIFLLFFIKIPYFSEHIFHIPRDKFEFVCVVVFICKHLAITHVPIRETIRAAYVFSSIWNECTRSKTTGFHWMSSEQEYNYHYLCVCVRPCVFGVLSSYGSMAIIYYWKAIPLTSHYTARAGFSFFHALILVHFKGLIWRFCMLKKK